MPAKMRRYFLKHYKVINNNTISREKKTLAYKNSLRKTKNKDEAMARNLLARDLRIYAHNKTGIEKARKEILAVKSSAKKFGWKEAHERRLSAELLRDGREMDRQRNWGVSFKSGLAKINQFYSPINLESTIEDYMKKRKMPKIKVLEIGTGLGVAASQLEKKFGGKIEITATGLLPLPEWKRYPNSKKINWRAASAENLKRIASTGTIDIIHSNLGFGHAHRINTAIKEAHRALKKGGLFLFTIEKELYKEGAPKNFEFLHHSSKPVKDIDGDGEVKLHVYMLRKK